MKTKLGKWMISYGVFLVAIGLAGYASNPEKAATALMSGGIFGGLSLLWGWMMLRGMTWSYWASIITMSLLMMVFIWRASVSWAAVANGNTEKLIAAMLISAMGLASVVTLTVLLRAYCSTSHRSKATP